MSTASQCEFNVGAELKLEKYIKGKKVLYLATTYLDYIRVRQELNMIHQYADTVEVIVAEKKSYVLRLVYVYMKLMFCRMSRYDVVFIGFAPQLVLPFWSWKFKHKLLVIDFFISLYDTLVDDRKRFKPNTLMAKLLYKIDRSTLLKADYIVADTRQHAEFFRDFFGANERNMLVLYLEADKTYYYPREAKKDEDHKDKYVILYFATVLPLQGVDIVIDAITNTINSDIHFIFIGPLNQEQKTRLSIQPNLSYYRWLSQPELADSIAQADLCLAGHFDASIGKAKRTIPGKAYIFEAMAKPMILGKNKANQERYPQYYKDIHFVTMGSSKALKQAIMKCYAEYQSAK